MDERDIEIRGNEARTVLDMPIFRQALEAAFKWGDEGLEKATNETEAWLALQQRRATRQAMAFLVVAVQQGAAVAQKKAKTQKLDDEGAEMRQNLAAYLENAKSAREQYAEKHGDSK